MALATSLRMNMLFFLFWKRFTYLARIDLNDSAAVHVMTNNISNFQTMTKICDKSLNPTCQCDLNFACKTGSEIFDPSLPDCSTAISTSTPGTGITPVIPTLGTTTSETPIVTATNECDEGILIYYVCFQLHQREDTGPI